MRNNGGGRLGRGPALSLCSQAFVLSSYFRTSTGYLYPPPFTFLSACLFLSKRVFSCPGGVLGFSSVLLWELSHSDLDYQWLIVFISDGLQGVFSTGLVVTGETSGYKVAGNDDRPG